MMKVLAFGIAIAAIGVAPAFANVDPKIAEFCLKAQDFQGCVNSMSGKKPEATETTIRQVQQQGANLSEGNYCPAQHIYSGGGYCQRVKCFSGCFGHDTVCAFAIVCNNKLMVGAFDCSQLFISVVGCCVSICVLIQ